MKSPPPPRQLPGDDQVGPNDLDRQRIRTRVEKALALGMFSDTVLRVDRLMDDHARLGARSSVLSLAKVIVPTLVVGVSAGVLWSRQHLAAPPQAHAPAQTAEPASARPPAQASSQPPLAAAESATPAQPPSASESATPAQPPSAAVAPALESTSTRRPARHAKNARTNQAAAQPSAAPPATPPPEEPARAVADIDLEPAPSTTAPRHLAEELRLMREASAALNAERYAALHQILREHELRFTHGALAQERRALGLIAVCRQGLGHTVRAELADFLHAETASPLASRVRRACEPER